MPKFWVRGLILLMFIELALRVPAMAQGETTSAIVGSVADPTGAAIGLLEWSDALLKGAR